MDARLEDRLKKWHDCIETLAAKERLFLQLEAEDEPLWCQLFLNSSGKTVTEREAMAFVHSDYRDFLRGLVEAKTDYNKERRVLELKQAAFNAEYLQTKTEAEAIQRYPKHL